MQTILEQLQEKVENLSEKIQEKQTQYYNLLTQDAACRLIARENNLKIETIKREKQNTPLSGLAVGDRVTNTFKIHYFSEPKTFTKNNRSGVLLTLGVKTTEGECTVVIWNKEARDMLTSNLTVNDSINIIDAVVKNTSPLEIHCDLLTKIEQCENSEIPNRQLKQITLEKLVASEELITTNGFLTSIGELKTFQRKNSGKNQEGKLSRCTL
ncbi:MAG: hypothetical protein V1644_00910, partial [Candidatus Micrarchaeota archaeon]